MYHIEEDYPLEEDNPRRLSYEIPNDQYLDTNDLVTATRPSILGLDQRYVLTSTANVYTG